jgi:hypothetical protein
MDKPDKIFVGPPPESLPDGGTLFHSGDAYLLATPERELASELAGTLWQWLELAERTMEDHAFRLDANRAADFCQGIRDTKSVLAKLESKK